MVIDELQGFAGEYIDSENPPEFLESSRQEGIINQLPELDAIIGVPQNPQFHPEGDVWQHTKMVCGEAAFIVCPAWVITLG